MEGKSLQQFQFKTLFSKLTFQRYIMQGNPSHPNPHINVNNNPPLFPFGKDVLSPELKVFTLNYCGIMNNPFEFYSQSLGKELQEISQIFDQLVQQQYHQKIGKDNKFKWKMGKVEQKVRVGRYSPSFDLKVGIHESENRFVNMKEFQDRWTQAFNLMTVESDQMFDEADIQTTKTYDIIYFHTLLKYVYKKDNFQELLKENPNKYREILGKFFNQSFLDQKRKLQKVYDTLFKLDFDILFLQEYSKIVEGFISKDDHFAYSVDASNDTMIVVKKSAFNSIIPASKVLSLQEMKAMNWSEKTSFLLVDNILLINAHLSSNQKKNPLQMQSLKQTLKALKQNKKDLHIILGGDLNAYLAPEPDFDKQFNMFPRGKEDITTLKMRTMAQGQYQKGNVPIIESKDKIITDLPIKKDSGHITFIDGKTRPDLNSYIPTDNHPFDHFLVACTVIRQ